MSNGLIKITQAIQTKEAWKDFADLANTVLDIWQDDDRIIKYVPPINSGWKTIDKKINQLKQDAGIPDFVCQSARTDNYKMKSLSFKYPCIYCGGISYHDAACPLDGVSNWVY